MYRVDFARPLNCECLRCKIIFIILITIRFLCLFILRHHIQFQTNPSVVNLSLGTARSSFIDWAVTEVGDSTSCQYVYADRIFDQLIHAGCHVVAAAGNHDNDAKYYSPAGIESAITVGASTFTNSRAWFSNKGDCVDVYAPGVFIYSATHCDNDNKGNEVSSQCVCWST